MHVPQAPALIGINLAGTALSQSRAGPRARRDAVVAALLAAGLGALLIVGVGFVHLEGIHDTAHDTRHSIGFPCH
ncbi:MAG: hypothetical protein EXR09_04035 [Acetobacteraceae bacterium]|nr:hypothetical protein [Acetobacteraceae bacterium]